MLIYLLEYILEKLLLPGQVESWIVIADLGGRGITDLPLSVSACFGFSILMYILLRASKLCLAQYRIIIAQGYTKATLLMPLPLYFGHGN